MEPVRKKLRRYEIPGHARFLTFSCFGRQPFFDDRAVRDVFADQLMTTRLRMGFKLHAWVVMPEHVHLLVRPDLSMGSISKVLMSLKRRVATKVLKGWREEGVDAPDHFWQAGGGYDRNIYSQDEMNEKIRYIHENPVRRGLVEKADDWEWSSARAWNVIECRWSEVDRC